MTNCLPTVAFFTELADSVRIVRQTKEKKKDILRHGETSNLSFTASKQKTRLGFKPTEGSAESVTAKLPNLNGAGFNTEATFWSANSNEKSSKKLLLKNKLLPPLATTRTDNLGSQATLTGTKQNGFKTARDQNAFQSTVGGKSSMINTQQSNFFIDLDGNPEMLKRFRTSQLSRPLEPQQGSKLSKAKQDEQERVSKILNKKKNLGETTSKAFFSSSTKVVLLDNKSPESLTILKRAMDDQNKQELEKLTKKTNDLMIELNNITHSVEQKEKVYSRLQEQEKRMRKDQEQQLAVKVDDHSDVKTDISKLHANVEDQKLLEDRLTRIIDICETNKAQNDEWIRQLNYYTGNLTKMIKEQQKKVGTIGRNNLENDNKLAEVFNTIKKHESNHNSIIAGIGELQAQHQAIQQHFMSTNSLVESSMKHARTQLEDMTKEKIRSLEEEEKEVEVQERNNEVKDELDKLRESLSRYGDIFLPGKNGETWDQKPEFKTLCNNLQEMKELQKDHMQKKFELERIERENHEMAEKIKVSSTNLNLSCC